MRQRHRFRSAPPSFTGLLFLLGLIPWIGLTDGPRQSRADHRQHPATLTIPNLTPEQVDVLSAHIHQKEGFVTSENKQDQSREVSRPNLNTYQLHDLTGTHITANWTDHAEGVAIKDF